MQLSFGGEAWGKRRWSHFGCGFSNKNIHAWKAKSLLQNNARTQKIIRCALVKENKKKCPQSQTKIERERERGNPCPSQLLYINKIAA